MYNVNDIFNAALLPYSGTSRQAVNDPALTIYQAALKVRSKVDIVEAERVVPLLPAVYSGENLYIVPEDFDIPISLDRVGDGFQGWDLSPQRTSHQNAKNRNRRNKGLNFSTEYRMGTRLMRITDNVSESEPMVLNSCSSLVGDGDFSAVGDAENLSTNEVFFLNNGASLDFDITQDLGRSGIKTVNMADKDISHLTRDATISYALYVPKNLVGNIDQMSIKIGSDESNFYEMKTNQNAYGNAPTEGYNTIRLNLRNATETGTVDDSNISYIEISIAHTDLEDAITGVKIDSVLAQKGVGYSLSYYSKFYFIDDNGNFIAKPTSDNLSEKTIFSEDTRDLVVYEAQRILDFEINGQSGGVRNQDARRDLVGVQNIVEEDGLYARYRRDNPSKRAVNISSY